MKPIFFGLWITASALNWTSAQTNLEIKLGKQIEPGPTQFGTITETEQKAMIRAVAALLNQHVTFRSGDTACSMVDSRFGRSSIEWKNLRIKMLVPLKVTETEVAEGIDKKIQALLIYDSCREWDANLNDWSKWGPRAHPLFPRTILLVWKGGHLTTDGGAYLSKFSPGPLVSQDLPAQDQKSGDKPASSAKPKSTFKPAKGGDGLPPGMKRAE